MNAICLETSCPFCGHTNTILVYEDDFLAWQNGTLIQDAFPYLSPEDREMLISGICPTCWEKMFGGKEEEDQPPLTCPGKIIK